MKKSISIWSFPADMAIPDCIKLAKRAGFEGIELALNENGPMSLESDADEIRSYRELARKENIQISSLATGLFWSYSLTSANAETRKKAGSIVKKQLDAAELLGVDTILVVPGAVGVDFIPGCEVVDYDTAYERALEAVKELAGYAEEKKVNIGLENVWNKFLLSPLETRSFIDSVNSEFVGAYLDVGNVVYAGYPEHWVKILGKRIKKVHFKDYRRDVGSVSGFVDLLSGDVNFPAVIGKLKEVGYDSFVTAEMIPPVPFYKYNPEQLIYNTSNSLDRILGR
ncbi:MAG: sugar phosphate isomerase/epimerase [Ruminiclostridium sp.]|nr:sugar phosphate isomerase/epimerase [Ruminiclostridium sp.]